MLTVWTDGQVFNNGTDEAEGWCCAVLDNGTQDGAILFDRFLGVVTSPVAEYAAIIGVLEWAQETEQPVTVITDSLLTYNQVYNLQRTSAPHLLDMREKVRYLLEETASLLVWQYRTYNKAGLHYQRKLLARKHERKKDGVCSD